MSGFFVVIPARMASSRLPGKPLADIAGKPMIGHVYDRAIASKAAEVIIATDSAEIESACRSFGARVEMTSPDHASGTDRIAEVADRLRWQDTQIVVNVQGDEPMIPPALIDQVAGLLEDDGAAAMATLMTPLKSEAEYRDPNMARVITDSTGAALYFSRAAIPASADGRAPPEARRHIGIYAYRMSCLRLLARTPVAPSERAERLEQLRALWLGQRIAIEDACAEPPRGVDTEDDLRCIRQLIQADADKIG